MTAAGPGVAGPDRAPDDDVRAVRGSWAVAAGLRRRDGAPAEPVRVAVSGRAGPGSTGNVSLVVGGGAPRRSRRRLLAAVGCTPDQGVTMAQVHGGEVVVVGRDDAGRGMDDHGGAVPGVDGLVTFVPGVALVVMVADCVPVLLHAPSVGVAAVHAGRGGVVAGVVGRAVGLLAAGPPGGRPSAPHGIEALVGPAIGGCCYEVPAAMAADVDRLAPGTAGTTRWGTPSLDLPSAVAGQLRAAGVRTVVRAGSCTRCDADRWFSHRADPGAGRQAAVVVRHAGPATERVQAPSVRPLVLTAVPAPQDLPGWAVRSS